MNSTLRRFLILVFAVFGFGLAGPPPAAAGMPLEFDVAENGSRFSFDETPLIDGGELDGFPAYGNEFVTEGYLYPVGTLDGGNGVLGNGLPEFPELVLGTWTCRGWHVGEGAATISGPWVATTQLFDLGEMPGQEMLVTDGFELPTSDPVARAVVGGTGPFATARGDSVQTFLGFNASDGVNLRVSFKIK